MHFGTKTTWSLALTDVEGGALCRVQNIFKFIKKIGKNAKWPPLSNTVIENNFQNFQQCLLKIKTLNFAAYYFVKFFLKTMEILEKFTF